MLGRRVSWKPCSGTSSGSGFRPIKFYFGMFMVCLCGLTTIWKFLQLIIDEQGKTETVVQQMDDDYTREMGFVRRSARLRTNMYTYLKPYSKAARHVFKFLYTYRIFTCTYISCSSKYTHKD
ncbi:hypothetical protein Tsp_11446 [Trichinella spiralis]|uniref:hypothetical protein n=1 Tax=Trichinella spiralis TaxID=6334 RepID=UPI0001EFDD8B|nr:hypothetical protein Tsp_11446 [Trichinella spiralis]